MIDCCYVKFDWICVSGLQQKKKKKKKDVYLNTTIASYKNVFVKSHFWIFE